MAAGTNQPGLTDEQRRAIDTRDKSVALSAGAGCGKTFVLTRRFLSHLDGIEPEQLGRFVAITFTDRAAREMRDRIRGACRERVINATDERQADAWLRLYRELESARISTIHSFCGSLLRAHAVEAGLDPSFQTLDEAQAATLRSEFLDGELRSLLANRDPAVMDLAVQLRLENLRSLIAALLSQSHAIDFDDWRARSADDLLAKWATFHAEAYVPQLARELVANPQAVSLLTQMRDHSFGPGVMRERQEKLLDLLPRLEQSKSIAADLDKIRENAMAQGKGVKAAWSDSEDYQRFVATAGDLRKRIDGAKQQMTFDPDLARPAAEAALRLIGVVGPIAARWQARKHELACLDFDDLLIRARDLLQSPENADVRRQASEQIGLLLVDESQDTDPVQIDLVRALCGDGLKSGKLFFVGDYKQSIYRFRGADPAVFRDLRESVPTEGRLPLTLNFRSQPAILQFVNALFHDALGPEYEPLRAHRPQVTATPAVEFLWAVPDDAAEDTNVQACRRLEARWIARRLRSLLDTEAPIVCETSPETGGVPTARSVRPGDVALLFRALSDVTLYEEALREQNIEYYLVGGRAFYAQQEVFDLLNLLRSLANPDDGVSLAGVLRSPFFGLADEALYWLAQHPAGLTTGLFASPPKELDQEQRRRLARAAETLGWLRSRKDRVPIADLIQDALARTGYDAVLLAEFLGERKLANLRKLIDQARGFDQAGIFTLPDFITQLAEFVAEQPREPLAATHPEATDVVRLMSIHQSKGLEFPVVVVPDLDRMVQSSGESVAFHPRLGPMVRLSGEEGKPVSGIHLFNGMQRGEEQDERIRLLYVATTRAADYLILSAGMGKLDSQRNPWRRLLAERFDLKSGDCIAELPQGYETTSVLVTLTEPALADGQGSGTRRRPLRQIVESARGLAAKHKAAVPRFIAPTPPDRGARRQFSFSKLSGAIQKAAPPIEPGVDNLPAADHEIDPLRLGTLVHEVLAVMPFTGACDLGKLVKRQAERRGESSEREIAETVDLVERFRRTPTFGRIGQAQDVHREIEFLLGWPIDQADGDRRWLQGVIDLLYQDAEGNWRLLDYKTNHVPQGALPQVAAAYELQMQVYAMAIERTWGQAPVSLELYFLRPEMEYSVSFDEAARRRTIAEVNASMAALAAAVE